MSKLKCFTFSLLLFLMGGVWAQEPVKAVVTYSILADFVGKVGGDLVNVTVLVGRDGDPHEYEPTPQDSVAMVDAALIFENGLGFETWLDDLYSASGSTAQRIVATEGIVPRALDGEEHPEDHEHGEFDPHVWHNPQLVITMVDNIAAALSEVDPTNEASYTANAEKYKAELEELDQDLQTRAETLSSERRKLFTSHDSLGYFAYRYGFEVIGAIISSTTTETSDANAGELAELVDTIKASGVPVIFVENITNANLLEQVAASAGVTVAPALYTDALGEEGSAGETYLGMMRYNMATIVEALRQE